MRVKLIVVGGGENTRFAVFGDADGLRALSAAFTEAAEGTSYASEIADLTTGQPITWDIHRIPEELEVAE